MVQPVHRATQSSQVSALAVSLRDGSHDFDFLIGNWKAHVRVLRDRLNGSNDWVEAHPRRKAAEATKRPRASISIQGLANGLFWCRQCPNQEKVDAIVHRSELCGLSINRFHG